MDPANGRLVGIYPLTLTVTNAILIRSMESPDAREMERRSEV